MDMGSESERQAAVEEMRARMAAANPTYDWDTVCENCGNTLGEHKGKSFYCVKGPKHFRTIAETEYRGLLIAR